MPIFDYKCADCQHVTTAHYSTQKDVLPQIECAWCQGTMVKLPSAPSFQIKGFAASNGYSK